MVRKYAPEDADILPEPKVGLQRKPTRKPVIKKAPAAAKRPPARKRAYRNADPDPDDFVDAMDEADDGDDESQEATVRLSRRMPDRQQAELTAALSAKLKGAPMFPFPAELKDEHKPYWVETVNSKPHDYFNLGDVHLLKLYCRVAADIDRLDREIAEEGSVVLNGRANPIVNPRVLVRGFAETRLLSLSSKLRLQPASRYDSENDKKQGVKKKRADAAVNAIEDDEDDLLATSGGGISANRTVQ